MYYVIDKSALWDLANEEVSKVADAAYAEDGTSLYDSIVLTEKDRATMERFMDDAISALVRRAFDICKYSPLVHYVQDVDGSGNPLYYVVGENGQPTQETTTTETDFPVWTSTIASIESRLVFYVPDFDTSMEDAVKEEIDRYVSMYACAALFAQRRASLEPEYTTRTQSAMDKAITLLKSRKHPLAQW